MSTEPGTFEVFGDYILLKLLASGGMAEVFLARPSNPNSNGRVVIIKRILKEIANDPVFIKMFRSEIRVTLGFNHPHTIQLHDFGEIDYQPYIAMEYIEGKSLKQVMEKFAEKGERIPVPTVLGLVSQAASGLAYAHHFENSATGEILNAVHRDISPHNLLVSYDGNLKVIDFGIAKAKGGIADKTRAGQIKGKCAYLSPEQLSEEELDGRSDIFSLGIVAWELLTSQRLFHKHGDTELQIIQRIQNCERHIVPPSHVNPEIPMEVDEVIMQALQKDRDQRYPNAQSFQTALSRTLRALYPSYTYADTAQLMGVLFETDKMIERMELREANDSAQDILSADLDAKTRVVDSTKEGFLANMVKGLRKPKHLPTPMEMRMGNIESMLKQKASGRHFAMVVFYALSIVGIKLDERYSLLDRFFMPAEAEMFAANNVAMREQYRGKMRQKISGKAELGDSRATAQSRAVAQPRAGVDTHAQMNAPAAAPVAAPAPVQATVDSGVDAETAPVTAPAPAAMAAVTPPATYDDGAPSQAAIAPIAGSATDRAAAQAEAIQAAARAEARQVARPSVTAPIARAPLPTTEVRTMKPTAPVRAAPAVRTTVSVSRPSATVRRAPASTIQRKSTPTTRTSPRKTSR